MKTKLTSKQIFQYLVIVIGICVLVWMIFLDEESTHTETSTKNTKVKAQDSQIGKTETAEMRNFSGKPKRFDSAPVYDEIVMAAKLRKQAIDQKEMEHFTYLKTSERNLILKSRISALEAEIAENNARAVKSGDVKSSTSKGNVNSVYDDYMPEEYPQHNGDGVVSYEDGQLSQNKEDRVLRVFGWSTKKRTVSLSLNDERFASDVRLNQVVFGRYKIKSIDESLRCVSLFDEKRGKKIPSVCYN